MSAAQVYQSRPEYHDVTRTPSEELPEKKTTDSESPPSLPTLDHPKSADDKQYGVPKPEEQDRGVSRIEALYLVFGDGGINIWALYLSIAIISYALALSSNTVSHWLGFATSSFGKHSLLGAVEVATTIVSGVGRSSEVANSYSSQTFHRQGRRHHFSSNCVCRLTGLLRRRLHHCCLLKWSGCRRWRRDVSFSLEEIRLTVAYIQSASPAWTW